MRVALKAPQQPSRGIECWNDPNRLQVYQKGCIVDGILKTIGVGHQSRALRFVQQLDSFLLLVFRLPAESRRFLLFLTRLCSLDVGSTLLRHRLIGGFIGTPALLFCLLGERRGPLARVRSLPLRAPGNHNEPSSKHDENDHDERSCSHERRIASVTPLLFERGPFPGLPSLPRLPGAAAAAALL